ncbi:MAG: type II toxin-antitoxin system HicB family antitoxin [Bacilli bacterium]|nr:type II toxin-antitoxin system HicB family antitoxin [Bacilli bacterium]
MSVYSTHVNIEKRTDDGVYWLVEGIEYPNLITDGITLEEAIDNAKDAWSLLCTVYEDKGVEIDPPDNKFDNETWDGVSELQDDTTKVVVFIDSFDIDVYRDNVSDYDPDKETDDSMKVIEENVDK